MAAQPTSRQIDPEGVSLALAMVLSSTAPLLLLDDACVIIAASASFCRGFNLEPGNVVGEPLFSVGEGEWGSPQLRMLLQATALGTDVQAYEMDLERAGQPGRCLVINAQQLAYGDRAPMRLLVSVADVTEARQSDKRTKELLSANELLIHEVRHRIDTIQQIIASVLMQSARRTRSEETRDHLRAAHHRVMSVAELQQQLASSTSSSVELRPYLTKLCQTITASMVFNPEILSISVQGDEAVVDAATSVSLGLIVTELVINSLKHAYPEDRGGRITVAYRSSGPAWSLTVADDGVGMPTKQPAMAGLGTTIVQALAKQLGAEVLVTDASPGVQVTIARAETADTMRTPALAV